MRNRLAIACVLAACAKSDPPASRAKSDPPASRAGDRDGDGLSDFAELHKYRTDPGFSDAAGRYAHTYSITSTLELVKPIDVAAMTDDYQDARLVSETAHTATVEVRSFPLGDANAVIGENPRWRLDNPKDPALEPYLAPGQTADWDADLRREILTALAADGIEPDRLTDRQLVERVSAWLFKGDRFRYLDHFVTYDVSFDHGRAEVSPVLRDHFDGYKQKNHLASDAETIALGTSGKTMFQARTRSDCTASAILQTTVLRALGIPTRLVLAVPLVDGNDPRQLQSITRNLHHDHVRNAIYRGQPRNSWASHTYNEVFVGGRWVPLNYARLGQSPLDAHMMGLMIRVATVRDWSEAPIAKSWGEFVARAARGDGEVKLSSINPYRSLALRDELGAKAAIPNPSEPLTVWDVGFDLEKSKARGIVIDVRADSAAARAGLRDGQEIVSLDIANDPDREAHVGVRDATGKRVIAYLPRKEELP